MDHLERPHDPAFPPLKVPILTSEPYDELGFSDYPSRCGFDESRLLSGDFSQHSAARTAGFLQNWLYFGVLRELLGKLGSRDRFVEDDVDFKNGRVTTALLDDSMCDLISGPLAPLLGSLPPINSQFESIQPCLRTLHTFCSSTTIMNDPRNFSARWPLPGEVDLSLRVLGHYMSAAFAQTINLSDSGIGHLKFPVGYISIARIKSLDWCPSEIAMLAEEFSPPALHYASTIKRNNLNLDHSSCGLHICAARQLSVNTYDTKHANENCSCAHISPPLQLVITILRNKQIPLITIQFNGRGGIDFDVKPYIKGQDYVAFSHVWSDGLGNPDKNTIPKCQFVRLKRLLDGLSATSSTWKLVNTAKFSRLYRRNRNQSLRFWLDTLCVPVETKYATERFTALQMMKDTYEMAHEVLILDCELEGYTRHSTLETFMRIRLSGWMRRLWTLQEGVLGQRLYVKFGDGYADLEKEYEALVGMSQYRTQTGRLRLDVVNDPRFKLRLGPCALFSDASRFYWKLRLLRSAFATPSPQRFLVGVVWPNDYDALDEGRMPYAIMEAFLTSTYRSTSREDDEFTCLASLLAWDISNLRTVPLHEQMHLLLSGRRKLPQGLLFLSGPRMKRDGWTWAVRSFGNHGYTQLDVLAYDSTLGSVSSHGFTVELPGLLLPSGFDPWEVNNFMTRCAGEQGLQWFRITRHEESQREYSRDSTSVKSARRNRSYVVIFYFPPSGPGYVGKKPMLQLTTNIRVAAVIISCSELHRREVLVADRDFYCSFEYLAHLECLGSSYAQALVSSLGASYGVVSEPVHIIVRKWTVG